MALRGVAPKPEEERTRRNAPIFSRLPVEWDGVVRGPVLPKYRTWSAWTKDWYEAFRRTPQSMVCTTTDWMYIVDTALLYELMWTPKTPNTQVATLAAEFRRRMSNYGYTFEDRLKLRMDVKSPQSEASKEAEIKSAATEIVDSMEIMNKYIAAQE